MRGMLILVFVLALLIGLVLGAPARLAFDALAPTGVQAGLVQGSVWRGQALRVSRGDIALQAVDMALEPASVLTLQPAMAVSVEDPAVRLTARLQARGEALRIEDINGIVSAAAFPNPAGLPIPPDSMIELSDVSVTLDRDGRCIEANGALMSPALADAGARYGMALPIVDMALSCEASALTLTLSGESPTLRLDGFVRLQGPRPAYRIVATPDDPDGGPVLSLLGFRAEGDRWVLDNGLRQEGE